MGGRVVPFFSFFLHLSQLVLPSVLPYQQQEGFDHGTRGDFQSGCEANGNINTISYALYKSCVVYI